MALQVESYTVLVMLVWILKKTCTEKIQYRDLEREYSWLLGDSGGFQTGKGKWEGDWRAGSDCAQAQKKRDGVPKWMDASRTTE